MRCPASLAPVLLVVLAACRVPTPVVDQTTAPSPWSEKFVAPPRIESDRVRLEPLAARFNELDFRAVSSSREHLRSTLQWGDWPPADMTAADNLAAIERHWQEFADREAYAYTVLTPAGTSCQGCVYLNPVQDQPRTLQMIFWVTEDQLAAGLDRHLVTTVLDRIQRGWPVDLVRLPMPVQNKRGIEILKGLGLEVAERNAQRQVFAWRRPR